VTRFAKFTAWAASSIGTFISGAISNSAAMSLNNGRMPVAFDGHMWPLAIAVDHRHAMMTASSHVKILCDYIFFGDNIYSLGDVMLFAGQFSMLCFIATMAIVGYVGSRNK
jgi:hypothetical protein